MPSFSMANRPITRACFAAALSFLVTAKSPGCKAPSLIQKKAALNVRTALGFSTPGGSSNHVTCTDLTNHGTHFTVDIEVGTPGQKFSVVADTGSNSLIIPSCVCQQRRYCAKTDRCFTGTNRSTSFSLKQGPKGGLQGIFMTFGSGTIEAIIAKEKVAVGHLGVDMKGGILLMVARNLNIVGKFEGILGLGLPSKSTRTKAKHHALAPPGTSGKIQDLIKKIYGGIVGGHDGKPGGHDAVRVPPVTIDAESPLSEADGAKAPLFEEVPWAIDDIGDIVQTKDEDTDVATDEFPKGFGSQDAILRWEQSRDHEQKGSQEVVGPKGLLEQAGISRFSMCFNDGAGGVLKLGLPEMPESLGSVGKYHWGLDFRGISVGDTTMPLSFCSAGNMTDGQETPCGAIPDSGTTVIMAPKEHLSVLFDSICDQWPRCVSNYTAMVKAAEVAKQDATSLYSWDPFEIAPVAKSTVLQLLLLDCGSWLNESTGLSELPNLTFHVSGAGGKKTKLDIPGWAYVLESTRDDAKANKQFSGLESDVVLLQKLSSNSSKVCSPAFGAMDYNTQKNGPVWILGTPFFYQYHVGYDLEASPPGISFTSTESTPCGSCGQQASLLDASSRKHPRWVSGPLRLPEMDKDLPL